MINAYMSEICPINKLLKAFVKTLLAEKPEKSSFKTDEEYRNNYAAWSTKVLLAQEQFSKIGKIN